MDQPAVIRPARPSETILLHDMWMAAPDRLDWAPGFDVHGPLLAELDLLAAEGRVWVALDGDDQLIGLAAAGEVDSALFLCAFGVAQAHRNHGVGAALLAAVVDFGRWAYFPVLIAIANRHGSGAMFLHNQRFINLDEERVAAGIRTIIAATPSPGRHVAMARRL